MSGLFGNSSLGDLASILYARSRVFVSYHHHGDQAYYNAFVSIFDTNYDVIQDCSLDRVYDSEDMDYVRWSVANNDIKGTSCTIVLCGAATPERKFVDWEIKATLDDEHGLIGIALPSAQKTWDNKIVVPSRLHANIETGYAIWADWNNLSVANLSAWIATAKSNAKDRSYLIVNPHELKQRNG
jgi:hypothetical protein